jgi:magnesium chelatase subunit ChlI-like protein
MTLAEAIDTTRIHRVAGRTGARSAMVTMRPCRAPPHTISEVGRIGGGQGPRPGEVSLAHHRMLLLDELPEFRRHGLEVLRQPLERCPPSLLAGDRPAQSRSSLSLGVRQRIALPTVQPCARPAVTSPTLWGSGSESPSQPCSRVHGRPSPPRPSLPADHGRAGLTSGTYGPSPTAGDRWVAGDASSMAHCCT